MALQDAVEIQRIDFPAGGLLVVENLTPFYACVAQFSRERGLMVLWTAGFPGRGIRAIIRHAAEREVPVRVWCDLDLKPRTFLASRNSHLAGGSVRRILGDIRCLRIAMKWMYHTAHGAEEEVLLPGSILRHLLLRYLLLCWLLLSCRLLQ